MVAEQDVEGENAAQDLGPGDAAGGGDEGLGRGVLFDRRWGSGRWKQEVHILAALSGG